MFVNDPRYDDLWEKIKKLSDNEKLSLLSYIYGYCHYNKEFFDGIETHLLNKG